jgi:membrane associated rhomboid family serine protease
VKNIYGNEEGLELSTKERFLAAIRLPIYFLIFIWAVHFYQELTGLGLGVLGILPRSFLGLRGLVFAPLLHADFKHIISNSLPFLAMSTLLIYFYNRIALRAFFMIYFLSGLVIWMFSENEGRFVIGLSYVVYGLVSLVFWLGVFRRSPRAIILSLIVLLFYSGMFAGILPTQEVLDKHISWEGHLFGAIIGIFAAYYYKDELEIEEMEHTNKVANHEAKTYYFERDVFEQTIAEREEEKRLRAIEEQNRRMLPPNNFGGWYSSTT